MKLNVVQMNGYRVCGNCEGLIETDYEWLGEVNGVGKVEVHERCEDCGASKSETKDE